MARFEGPYLYAFLAGLFFIALFAWDRLNHRVEADRTLQRQKRFIALLAPSKLLRTAMYVRGWAVYFVLLSLFFFIFCSVGEPLLTALLQPHFKQIGFENFDPAEPVFPLVISLIITGVLPQFPILKRLEEHARRLTHRLVGIPDSFNDLTDALFEEPLDENPLDATAIARIDEACKTAKKILGDVVNEAQLRGEMTKLYSVEWIGGGQIWPKQKVVSQFVPISSKIGAQVRAIDEDIDDLIARTQDRNSDQNVLAMRCRAVLSRLSSVADDVCALIAIYAENATTLPRPTPTDPARRSPVSLRFNALREWIQNARRIRDVSQNQFSLLLQNLVFVTAILFLVGYLGGAFGYLSYKDIEGPWFQQALQIGFAWLFGTICLYGPAAIIGWGMRTRRIDNGTWPGLNNHDVFPWGPYLMFLICCYIVAVLSLCLFSLADAYFRAADQTIAIPRFVQEGQWRSSFVYALMGTAYATAMAIFFDLRDARRSSLKNLISVGAGLVLTLAIICWIASVYQFAPNLDVQASTAVWSTIWYQTIAAVMFGLTVSLSTILTLRRLDTVEQQRREAHDQQNTSPNLSEAIP